MPKPGWTTSSRDITRARRGRFTSRGPILATPLHVINPQRWNMYVYAANNPLSYTDPDGKAAVAVNFVNEIPVGGHEGIIVIHDDGRATYARYGPVGGNRLSGQGEVTVQPLRAVQLRPDGLPTDSSYKQLAEDVAKVEGQPAATVGFNYFRTTETESISLEQWMYQMKALSDRGEAPCYDVAVQNCATFTIAGLLRANAIKNENISIIPNRLFMLLWTRAAENYTWEGRKKPTKEVPSAGPRRGCLINRDTGECVQ